MYTMEIPLNKSISFDELFQRRSLLEQNISCQFCMSIFESTDANNREPKRLPCNDVLCANCIDVWIKTAEKKNDCFSCPICKTQVNDVKCAKDIPTSQSTVSLVEKQALFFTGLACCPECSKVKMLDVCFECCKPLCISCLKKHYENWERANTSDLVHIEGYLCRVTKQMDTLKNNVNQNIENILNAKKEIESRYQSFIDALNKEKTYLCDSLDVILKEMNTFNQIESEASIACKKRPKIPVFDEFNSKIYAFNKLNLLKNDVKEYKENHGKLKEKYEEYIQKPLRALQAIIHNPSYLLGDIATYEVDLKQFLGFIDQPSVNNELFPRFTMELLTQADIPVDTQSLSSSTASTPSAPPSPSAPTFEPLDEQKLVNSWVESSHNPYTIDIQVDHAPKFMSAYNDKLFVCNEFGRMTTFKVANKQCEKKFEQSLNFTNIRGMASNSKYVAFTYSDLKKDEIKRINKKMSANGIAIFEYTEYRVWDTCKTFKLKVKNDFATPGGLYMTENYMFACDKAQHKVYKINFNGDILEKFIVDGIPHDVSINSCQIAISDYSAHEIVFINQHESSKTTKLRFNQDNNYINGPLNLCLTEDNMLFVLPNSNAGIDFFDKCGKFRSTFNVDNCSIYNFVVMKMSFNSLITGCKTNNNKYKIVGFCTN